MPVPGTLGGLAQRAGKWLYRIGVDISEESVEHPAMHQRFLMLHAYYNTEQLYSRIRAFVTNVEDSEEFYNIENLRSPAFEATEFHVGHWFPGKISDKAGKGALPIDSSSPLDEKGRKAVYEIWKASNYDSKKQTFARTICWSGNGFQGIAQRDSDGMPYKRIFEPQYVRAFDVDERGFVTYFRYAYPVTRGKGRNKRRRFVTEVFSKERQDIRIYEDTKVIDEEEDFKGGDNTREKIITFKSMGIDFVPVVWAPFMETSPGKGTGVFEPHLDKIDNVNRAATRLDDMLFRYNKAYWFLESAGLTADNVEMPPPSVEGSYSTAYTNLDEDEKAARGYPGPVRHEDGTLTIGNDVFIKTPMGWTLRNAVPQVDYQGALNIIDAHMAVLKRDMPELRYNDAIESAARDSAKVLELQLAGAIDRGKEGRGNAEAAIIRTAQMGITVGQKGLKRSREVREIFAKTPTFGSGDMDFWFSDRPVIPPTPTDKAAEDQAQAQALTEKINVARAMQISTDVLKPEVAKLFGVDEGELEEEVVVNPEGIEEGAGGDAVVAETDSIVKSLLGQGGQGGQAQQQNGRRSEGGG